MSRRLTRAALCLLAAGVLTTAHASGLRVTPLRLDLSAKQNATQIELTNFGSGAVPVQVSVVSWSQADGRDTYAPSKDIFFAPPIVSVPAGGKTVVRFRLRGAAPADVERAYRVYFQEVAPPQPPTEGGMSFRLKFGVPLFIAPPKPVVPRIEVERHLAGGVLDLTLANRGSAHLKIHGLEIYPATVDRQKPTGVPVAKATHSVAGANYLLPGTQHRWSLKLPAGAEPARHVLLVRTDDYSSRAAAGMTPAGWLWLPLRAEAAAPERDGRR
jgi:fimbrial chaperone protein